MPKARLRGLRRHHQALAERVKGRLDLADMGTVVKIDQAPHRPFRRIESAGQAALLRPRSRMAR